MTIGHTKKKTCKPVQVYLYIPMSTGNKKKKKNNNKIIDNKKKSTQILEKKKKIQFKMCFN